MFQTAWCLCFLQLRPFPKKNSVNHLLGSASCTPRASAGIHGTKKVIPVPILGHFSFNNQKKDEKENHQGDVYITIVWSQSVVGRKLGWFLQLWRVTVWKRLKTFLMNSIMLPGKHSVPFLGNCGCFYGKLMEINSNCMYSVMATGRKKHKTNIPFGFELSFVWDLWGNAHGLL